MKNQNPLSRTLIQSAVLGLIGGPIMWALHGGSFGSHVLWWDCLAMALAPPLVDGFKYLVRQW